MLAENVINEEGDAIDNHGWRLSHSSPNLTADMGGNFKSAPGRRPCFPVLLNALSHFFITSLSGSNKQYRPGQF